MRTLRYPKPARRGPKQPRPIRRGTLPRARVPAKHGDYRARFKYAQGLWAKLIKAKEPSGICPMCFKRRWYDSAHCWIKGRYRALALDPDNGAPLCRVCHRIVDSDHQLKESFFMTYMGPSTYERLRLQAIARSKVDLDLMILLLEQDCREKGLL